jgi:hypothetical protein
MAKNKSKKAQQGTDNGVAISLGGLTINEYPPNAPQGKKPKQPKPSDRDIAAEFASYFGNESNLANWQRFCQDLGVTENIRSVTQCKAVCTIFQELLSPPFPSCHTWYMNMELTPDQQAMRGIWVNIYDFIDAKAAGMQVKRFKSERALSHYTRRTGRIYPKERAKKGGPVRALLAHIFG